MTIIGESDVVRRLLADRPSFHLCGEARWDALPGALEAIRASARPGDATIEIGAGASTVVFAASGAHHTCISPNPAEHQLVRDYCRQIGADESRVRFITGLSEDVLPALLGLDRTLAVAFIDGAHSFPFPVIDWYYISRSLKIGGKLLLDDIPIPAVAQVFQHMRHECNWRLDGVYDDRAAAFTLLAPPGPESWACQAYNRGYPDFSFAGLPRRSLLLSAHRIRQLRRRAGSRYPSLRRMYRRLV
jgi:predicted O-methyltransferase YrrM